MRSLSEHLYVQIDMKELDLLYKSKSSDPLM